MVCFFLLLISFLWSVLDILIQSSQYTYFQLYMAIHQKKQNSLWLTIFHSPYKHTNHQSFSSLTLFDNDFRRLINLHCSPSLFPQKKRDSLHVPLSFAFEIFLALVTNKCHQLILLSCSPSSSSQNFPILLASFLSLSYSSSWFQN